MQKHEAHGSSEMEITTKAQIVGHIEHHMTGEPVRVTLTAAGLSLPNGAALYDQSLPSALIDMISCDAFAMSFQSVGQYRCALLSAVHEIVALEPSCNSLSHLGAAYKKLTNQHQQVLGQLGAFRQQSE